MAIHSSTLTWRIPWKEEPGRLQSMGSQRVGHDWVTSLHFTFSFLSDIYPGMELLGHMVVLFLVFWETSILFSLLAAPIYIPINSVGGFPLLHILTSICYLHSLWLLPGLQVWCDISLWFWFKRMTFCHFSICGNMDGLVRLNVKVREKQIMCDATYIWNVKNMPN